MSITSIRIVYTFGPYQFDAKDLLIKKNGSYIPVTRKAAETLLVLIESAGHIVDKETLLQRVWPDTFVEESTLAQNILTLRKALGKQATGEEFIGTVSRRGYRFAAPVALESAGAPVPPQTPFASLRARTASRQFLWVLAAVFAALVLAGWFGFVLRHRAAPAVSSSGSKLARLAVLPFANLSGDSSRDYLSDGFTEEMITQLGQLNPDRLTVIARTSAMRYRGSGKDARQIGKELGVDYLLGGSVRQEGKRVRVSAQLIRVSDQSNLWAANYDRELRDVLGLQSEVTRAIAREIAVKIAPGKAMRIENTRAVDPEAYELYLKGRHFWNRRTAGDIQKAIDLFRQSIAFDPQWARAHAALADCYVVQFIYVAVSAHEVLAKARAEAQRALELDPTLAEAHATLASAYFYDFNFPAAEKEFQRSFEDNPRYATAHQWYGEFLRETGRFEEAIEQSKLALEIDPLSPIINVEAALPYYLHGEQDKAAEQLRRAIELDPYFAPAHGHMAMVLEQQGKFEEALQEILAARALGDSPWMSSVQGIILARMGRAAEARQILNEKLRSTKLVAQDSGGIAEIQLYLGEREEAIQTLLRAFRDRNWQLTGLKADPRLRPLLSDPRIQEVLRDLGFKP